MGSNLESKINQGNNYKSAGERKIVDVLNKYGIDFRYESPVLINDHQGKQRIWYPDFYLPEFGVCIENYGSLDDHLQAPGPPRLSQILVYRKE
jgi:DNA helicase-4